MGRHLLSAVAVCVSLTCATAALGAERSPSRFDATRVVLTIAVAEECPAAEDAMSRAQQEAASVWSRANVVLRWVPPSSVPFAAPLSSWLIVRCASGVTPNANAASDDDPSVVLPIAQIRFIDSLPTNTIVLNLDNANALLRREAPDQRYLRGWFIPFRDIRLGRMLGRAIAHEIGHFLNQSGAHTRGGLMRASHSLAALVGPSLAPFRVDEARLARGGQPVAQPES